MFENYDVTGQSDDWIAVPDGFKPASHGDWKRVATGERQALQMFREAHALTGKLPKVGKNGHTVLYVHYSARLCQNRDIEREVKNLKKRGGDYGIQCHETVLVEPK